METSQPQFTAGGNRKKPSYQVQVSMISEAIKKVNHISMISKSFIVCGLTNLASFQLSVKKSIRDRWFNNRLE